MARKLAQLEEDLRNERMNRERMEHQYTYVLSFGQKSTLQHRAYIDERVFNKDKHCFLADIANNIF